MPDCRLVTGALSFSLFRPLWWSVSGPAVAWCWGFQNPNLQTLFSCDPRPESVSVDAANSSVTVVLTAGLLSGSLSLSPLSPFGGSRAGVRESPSVMHVWLKKGGFAPLLTSHSLFLSIGELLSQLKQLVQSRTSYYKPKSIIRPFIDYLFPNTSKFDLLNFKTNSKVNKLIVLGVLLDLVPVNNPY